MARPRKKGLDYFAHDVGMRHDLRLRALQTLHGISGYGTYCILLECIYAEGGKLDLSDAACTLALAGDLGLAPERMEKILEDAVSLGLFDQEPWRQGRSLSSARIRRQVEQVEKVRKAERDKHAGTGRNPGGKTGLSQPEMPQSIAKESIEYKSSMQGEEEGAEAQEGGTHLPSAGNDYEDMAGMLARAGLRNAREIGALCDALAARKLGPGFVRYCQDRVARQKARNPPGLLREALCSYPEWERDYRESIREEGPYPRIRPEVPMTAAERSEAVDTVRRVLRGIGVGGEGGR